MGLRLGYAVVFLVLHENWAEPTATNKQMMVLAIDKVSVHGLNSSRHTPCAVCRGFLQFGDPQYKIVVAIDGTPADGTRSVPATFRQPLYKRLLDKLPGDL
jgi:hypothetical protein